MITYTYEKIREYGIKSLNKDSFIMPDEVYSLIEYKNSPFAILDISPEFNTNCHVDVVIIVESFCNQGFSYYLKGITNKLKNGMFDIVNCPDRFGMARYIRQIKPFAELIRENKTTRNANGTCIDFSFYNRDIFPMQLSLEKRSNTLIPILQQIELKSRPE